MAIRVTNPNDARDVLWAALTQEWGERIWSICAEEGHGTEGGGDIFDEHDVSNASETGALKLSWDGTHFNAHYDEGSGWQDIGKIDIRPGHRDVNSSFRLGIGGGRRVLRLRLG